MRSELPTATYRIQLSRDFDLFAAAELLPYLQRLGVSHCYVSPILQARTGSLHGYDIVDHNTISSELGGRAGFERFTNRLRKLGLGLIVDIVPNHMGIGDDNHWWMDLLCHGEASPYAGYFDIDWHPLKHELNGKVLLPVLEDHYGNVLEAGGLSLHFMPLEGNFFIHYYQHRFPVDPATFDILLSNLPGPLSRVTQARLDAVISGCRALPLRSAENSNRGIVSRELYGQLVTLCHEQPELLKAIETHLAKLNGIAGEPASFEGLHALLERQAYRLAFWRVASDEINYRRFFDINDLAGLRQELPAVFEATHRLILELVEQGLIQGLRIDHPDGLSDPAGYLQQLCEALRAQGADENSFYVVVEKILMGQEKLARWPVHGTTGYDFAYLVDHLLLHAPAGHRLASIYHRFVGHRVDYGEAANDARIQVITYRLSSELTVLVNLLNTLAQADHHSRDYTLNSLRRALVELAARFPVYRTYITGQGAQESDRHSLEWAAGLAKRHGVLSEIGIFDFLLQLITLERRDMLPERLHWPLLRFVSRFQQYTAAVVAKSMEDTLFYRYQRLIALNEVGGDPRQFAISPEAFHRANRERLEQWPFAMVNSSTHDSKRSEDLRMRLLVVTEMTGEWEQRILRWHRMNRGGRVTVAGKSAPTRNDEYHLYQILLGSWPLGVTHMEQIPDYQERVGSYMRKAVREAKEFSSWLWPNEEYEAALSNFVRYILRAGNNPFLSDFVPFAQQVARAGLYNSLTQLLLKLTVPGVPDLYQGNETWTFRLVDPDNRSAVDFTSLSNRLAEMERRMQSPEFILLDYILQLMEELETGEAKLYMTWRLLNFRRENPLLFQRGEYLPLLAEGERADQLILFARHYETVSAVVVAPRYYVSLLANTDGLPHDQVAWGETTFALPAVGSSGQWCNLLTGEQIYSYERDGKQWLTAAEALHRLPVALLVYGLPSDEALNLSTTSQ